MVAVRPLVMGILNVTPDSFSDGGRFLDPAAAVDRGLEMVAEGADVIDVGGESSRPGADQVSATEELRRVVPVVTALAPHVRVSIDTAKPEVATEAVAAGARLVNDITASLWPVAAETGAGWLAMHMKGTPRSMQDDPRYDDVVAEVAAFLSERARVGVAAGVSEVWIDPGIGFGKTVAHNLSLLAGLRRLTDLGHPVAVGVSRKAFLGVIAPESGGPAPVERRKEASVAAAVWAADNGASMLRVHDVSATVAAMALAYGDAA